MWKTQCASIGGFYIPFPSLHRQTNPMQSTLLIIVMAHMDKNEVNAQKLSELSCSETKEAPCAWAACKRSTEGNS
jgi:hypothetical protein